MQYARDNLNIKLKGNLYAKCPKQKFKLIRHILNHWLIDQSLRTLKYHHFYSKVFT